MKRRKELTTRFRKVAWGRLYWKKNQHHYTRRFDSDDVCVVMDGTTSIHYKTIEAFIEELENAEALDKQVAQMLGV